MIQVEVVWPSLYSILCVDKCSQTVTTQHLDNLNKPQSQIILGKYECVVTSLIVYTYDTCT